MSNNGVPLLPLICVDQASREKSYALDSFWLQNLHFTQRIDTLGFRTLFEVRDMATHLFNLALEYNLEDSVKSAYVDKIKFVNYLLENLGHNSHSVALHALKEKFGSKKGMSSKSKKEADKIIKKSMSASSTLQMPSQPLPNTGFPNYMGGPLLAMPMHPGPFGGSQNFGPLNIPNQIPQQGGRPAGPCFNCQQLGHVARDCPLPPRSRGPMNRRNNGNQRGNPNNNRRSFGKKKG